MTTHFAFSDDSKHKEGRYNSLGLITMENNIGKKLHEEVRDLLKSSSVDSEFKWAKLTNAKYRFAAKKMIDLVFRNKDKLRVDVLIWDIEDARHKDVRGRDDKENLVRMYYHLIAATCSRKWPVSSVSWMWYPDEQSSVQWTVLRDCIRTKKHKRVADLFGINPRFEKVDLRLQPVESHKYPLVQLADLFAGLGAYSWGNFPRFLLWLNKQKGEGLFAKSDVAFSNSENERFQIIDDFRKQCRVENMKISLESSRGFKSNDPRKTINFWLYEPQHSLDKAPRK